MQYIDDYKVLKELGKGGFGKVYLVEDEKTDQLYALKLLKSVYNVQRVKTHLDVLKILNTSAIFIKTYKSKRLATHLMILMEYVDSENLETITKENIFNEKKALSVISDIVDSLEFLHAHNLMHGDVKAENILQKNDRYVLVDYDVVKRGKIVDTVHIQGDNNITAPEIYKGVQTPSSDIYSLGCTLYYLLTAKHIYGLEEQSDFSSIMFSHLYKPINTDKKISSKMYYLISRMTEKDYTQRADIKEIRQILNEDVLIKKSVVQVHILPKSKFKRYQYMAEDGVAYAQNILALMYEEGLEVTKDIQLAFSWYKKAADKGLAKAEFNLGLCYKYAKGCAKNDIKAFECFHLAAQKNHNRSLYHLAQMYEEGTSGKVDLKQALLYYKKSALHGYKPAYEKIE